MSALILIRREARGVTRPDTGDLPETERHQVMNIAAEKRTTGARPGSSRQNDEIRLKNIFLDHS